MAILGLGWLAIKKMSTADPKNMKANMRKVGGVAAVGLGIILTLRGALPIAIPVFLFGLSLLGLGHLAGIQMPWESRTPGQKSQVRTSMLQMGLDHDSTDIEGTVLKGEFKGRALSSLQLDELLDLHGQCLAAGDQSPQLLEAYLDTKHPDWRDDYSGKTSDSSSVGKALDEKEALAILGLEKGASAKQIKTAHRALMKKYHPDHGGSDYLAARINEAKDLLLG